MSTLEGRKSPKHERVTRATAAATAAAAASKASAQTAAAAASKAPAQTATAAASKAPAQTATAAASKAPASAATAPKALEEMASMAPEQTASKAKEEDSDDDSRIDRLETNIKVLQCTDSILLGEISELKEFITVMNSRWVRGWSPDKGEPRLPLSITSLSKGFFSLLSPSLSMAQF